MYQVIDCRYNEESGDTEPDMGSEPAPGEYTMVIEAGHCVRIGKRRFLLHNGHFWVFNQGLDAYYRFGVKRPDDNQCFRMLHNIVFGMGEKQLIAEIQSV